MARVEFSMTIARPVSEVFHVLSSPESTPEWSASAIEEHITTPGPLGIGSRRRATVRGFGRGTTENEIEVTEYEPDRRLAIRSIEAPVAFTSVWTFSEIPDGTRVDWTWSFDPDGWLRPFGGLIARAFARGFRRDLDRLKMMMESGRH